MTEDNPNQDGSASDSLAKYRAKRSADTSPEPVGTVSAAAGSLFVVHKHAASHLHWDLRMEMDGVLKSWAVPRGPSYDMADKRLAVRVEDHPLEYGDFEGVIPKGNYGAGGIIVWDRGEWVALEDWREGLEKGKLLFELKGYKLKGKWTLVKIKKTEKEWLLIKERDAYVKSPGDEFNQESVLSGLTVEQVKDGEKPGAKLLKMLEGTAAKEKRVNAINVKVMLAEPSESAFTRDGWLFELKLDGYRLLAAKRGHDVLLLTRNGNDYTHVFPEVAKAMKALPYDSCIIDGEVVVLDDQGKPSFSRLQRRGRLQNDTDIGHAAVELSATYFAFDVIAFDDWDLRPMPLIERRAFLLEMVPKLGAVRAMDHLEREGELFLREVSKLGLEGIIAKKASSTYEAGRSPSWLKMKAERSGDFVIVGYTQPKGGRMHIGALQLAEYVNGHLRYVGRVGTGMNDAMLNALMTMLAPIIRKEPPCEPPVGSFEIPDVKTTTWTEPRYGCEVQYRELTPDGLLRHAAFLRLRDDKRPEDCERLVKSASADSSTSLGMTANAAPPPAGTTREGVIPSEGEAEVEESAPPAVQPRVQITNPQKIYWPAEKYTKGDLIEYYRAVSKWILPYLKNRPLVLTRFPDGIDGKQFYQKDAPEFAPEWIRKYPIWSEDTQRNVNYFVCDDEDSLLYIANLGSIPLHIWASSIGSLEQCDWCVIDLDPKEAPFSDVIRCAQVLHRLCDEIGLQHYVKTTGKTGLHIMIPLARLCTYEQSRTLGELLARLVLRETGDIATITRHVTKRGDKVYLDYLQNRRGQTIVAPFSVRPLPGATVSMPLVWDEVQDGLNPKDYTIMNAIERMEHMGADPCAPVLTEVPDLVATLQKIAEALASS